MKKMELRGSCKTPIWSPIHAFDFDRIRRKLPMLFEICNLRQIRPKSKSLNLSSKASFATTSLIRKGANMKLSYRKILTGLVMAAAVALPSLAQAENGMNQIGYGVKSKGM